MNSPYVFSIGICLISCVVLCNAEFSVFGEVARDPCSSDNHISWRTPGRSVDARATRREDLIDDSSLATYWYRFEYREQVEIPESCPPAFMCSTMNTAWLNDAHPPNDGSPHLKRFCVNNNIDCQSSCFNALVKNCGTYYVYRLPPLPRNSGYCTGSSNKCVSREGEVFPWGPCEEKGKRARVYFCTAPNGNKRFVRETVRCTPDDPEPSNEVSPGRCVVKDNEVFPWGACSKTCGTGERSRVFYCTLGNGARRFIQEITPCNPGTCAK